MDEVRFLHTVLYMYHLDLKINGKYMFTISLIYSHSSIYDPHIKGLTAGGGPIFTVVHIYVQLH